jgi:thioredoxin reductase
MSGGEAALAATASLLALSRDIVVCTNGAPLSHEHRTRIEEHGIVIVDSPLVRAEEAGEAIRLHFADGVVLERAALFLRSELRLTSDIPEQLGCSLGAHARILVDANWETSVAGVYAAGDAAADKKFVAVAAASGAESAMAIDGALAQEDFGGVWSGPLCGGAGAFTHAPPLKEAMS